MKTRATICMLASAFVTASCGSFDVREISRELSASTAPEVTPPAYLRVHELAGHPRLRRTVNANFSPGEVPLQAAIVSALPFPVSLIAEDSGVNLSFPVSVRAKGVTVRDYLRQLEGLTGYRMRPDDEVGVIRIASQVTKSWDLSALAGVGNFKTRLGFSGDEGESSDEAFRSSHEMSIQRAHEDSVWDNMLQQAHCILGTPQCAQEGETVAASRAWIVDNRRMGMVMASGSPQRIERLDRWMSELAAESERIVRLECAILDVSTNNIEALGLRVDALFDSGRFGASFQRRRTGGDPDDGLLVGVGVQGSDLSLDALIDNLSSVGDVRIHSRVKFSVTNGATAYLNTGEVFSYISNTDTLTTDSGTTRGFQQSRLQVGLQLAITPRFLNSGRRMLLEVTPILSSLLRFEELRSGDGAINAPVIALRQMTSQAVTSSGRPIAIGGLEWQRSLSNESNVYAPGFLRELLSNRRNETELRQLLIIVTPWEVG